MNIRLINPYSGYWAVTSARSDASLHLAVVGFAASQGIPFRTVQVSGGENLHRATTATHFHRQP